MNTALLLALTLLQTEPPAQAAGSPASVEAAASAPAPESPEVKPDAPATVEKVEPPAASTPVPAAPEVKPDASAAVEQAEPPAAVQPAAPAPVEPAAAAAQATPAASAEAPQAAPAEPPPPVLAVPVEVAPALAPAAAPSAAPSESSARRWEARPRRKRMAPFGLSIDAGFPDAAGVSAVFRPWYWIRLEAGGTTTYYASHGYRVGVSLVAFKFPLTPALTLNYGQAFEANWNGAYERFATPNPDLQPVLQKFGYRYVDAHFGLEMGAPSRFVFFLRAGFTQIWTTLHGLNSAAAAAITDADTSVTLSDAKVTFRAPVSVKLGFIVYLF